MMIKTNKLYILLFALFITNIFSLGYSLPDVNTTSDTYQEIVGPSFFSSEGKPISINYFGWEDWGGWRSIFVQLCNLSNTNTWDTEQAVLIGVGVGSGGDIGLDGIINIEGVNAPFVQDETGQIWEDFLGSPNAQRKQVVLLDQNFNNRFQFQYDGAELNEFELNDLLDSIQLLINEVNVILGDLNNDQLINLLDIILLINIAIDISEYTSIGDMNNDGGINILDVVLLLNQILLN